MKRIPRTLLFWANVLFSAGLLMSQETPSAPVRISDTSLDGVTLTNQSSKGIVAYILKLHYAGLSGNLKSSTFRAPKGPNQLWAPGETWRHEIVESSRLRIGRDRVRPTTPPQVELSYVLFTDGTSWGTDPYAKHVEGM